MSIIFNKIFNHPKPLMGMIHLKPLLGIEEFVGLEKTIESALQDLEALESAGFNGVIVENNYDIPHKIKLNTETVACMAIIVHEIRKKTTLPIGVCALWNDYEASMAIAKLAQAQFIRIPCFVDHVKTNYGEVVGSPDSVMSYKKSIEADDIALFVDVHVKHAEVLTKTSLSETVQLALSQGADGVIITGKWTGDLPDIKELKTAKAAANQAPVIIGSGGEIDLLDKVNDHCDGIIVGTSIKTGQKLSKNIEVNLKNYDQRIDPLKAKEFVSRFRTLNLNH